MRLIDAKSFKAQLIYLANHMQDNGHSTYAAAVGEIISILDRRQTIDAVPIVRCKDCKYFMPYTESHRKASGFDGDCAILAGYTDCDNECVHETDFCSRGARMDGEENAAD